MCNYSLLGYDTEIGEWMSIKTRMFAVTMHAEEKCM